MPKTTGFPSREHLGKDCRSISSFPRNWNPTPAAKPYVDYARASTPTVQGRNMNPSPPARLLAAVLLVLLLTTLAACSGDEAADDPNDPFANLQVPPEYAARPTNDMVVVSEDVLQLELLQLNPRTREVGEYFLVWAYLLVDQEFWDFETEFVVSGAVTLPEPERWRPNISGSQGWIGPADGSGVSVDLDFALLCATVGIGTYSMNAEVQINDADGNPTGAPFAVTADATVDCVASGASSTPTNAGTIPTSTPSGSANVSPDATITAVDPGESAAILVNGMLIDATGSQWNGPPRATMRRSWSEFAELLRYGLYFSVSDGPIPPAERQRVEYQVFEGAEIIPFGGGGGSKDPREHFLIPQQFPADVIEDFVELPGPGQYNVKGTVGEESFDIAFSVEQPPILRGALVPPGEFVSIPIDAYALNGLVNVEGTWSGRLPEGYESWGDVKPLSNLSQIDLKIVDRFLEPMPTGIPQARYEGESVPFDLMRPVVDLEGTLRFTLGARGWEGGGTRRNAAGGAFVCATETVTYELKGRLEYSPQGPVWGAEFDLTGTLVTPLPLLVEELPQSVEITEAYQPEEIDQLRLIGHFDGPFSETSNGLGFLLSFSDLQSNPASMIHEDSGCISRLEAGALLAFPAEPNVTNGPISGKVTSPLGTATTVTAGTAELHVAGGTRGAPLFATNIGEDGSFTFPEVPTYEQANGEWTQALYDIVIEGATGRGDIELHGTEEVTFDDLDFLGVFGLTNHEIELTPNNITEEATHFIAVGDRGVGGTPVVFHYSLEYWECGGDFTPLQHAAGFTPAEVVAKCKGLDPTAVPQKLGEVELLARTGWEVWAGAVNLLDSGKNWIVQDVWVAEIVYSGTAATELMPIFTGSEREIEAKWQEIIGIAETYRWAEQPGFATGPTFAKWPASLYQPLQTNSNTFIRYLVSKSGLSMVEQDGSHPGNDTPIQNTDTDLGRHLTFYEIDTPWTGTPAKPEPVGTPP